MPPNPLADALLAQLSDLVTNQMGLNFARARWPDLERGVRAAALDAGYTEPQAYAQWLVSTPLTAAQRDRLAGHLTVGETYFFREPQMLTAVQEHVLPDLIRARRGTGRPVRLWSAGCCTGEEPYTLAIILNQMLPAPADPPFSLLATDLNPQFLRKAEAGVYGEWSFRDPPAGVRERYFTRPAPGRYELRPQVRRQVTFSLLNLAQDAYPSLPTNTTAMDIIFCRNVLMYLTPEWATAVVAKLRQALVEGGWLVVSSTEASQVLFADFAAVRYPQVTLYRKDSYAALATFSAAPLAEPALEWLEPLPATPFVFQPPPAPMPHPTPEYAAPPATAPEAAPVAAGDAAEVLYAQGHYAEAEAAARAQLAAQPADHQAVLLLARIDANLGRLPEALAWCQQAIEADRLNPTGYYLQATIEQERGELEAARSALKRALYLDPDFVLAHYALGMVARRQGQGAEAARHFENTAALLDGYAREALLPESDGLTAGRLLEIVRATATPQRQV